MDEEKEFLTAIRNLDQSALATVFDRYAPALFKYAMRLTGNQAESDDVVGDVFDELLKHLKRGKGPTSNLRSYLYQVAYHKVVDRSRHQKHWVGLEDVELRADEEPLHASQEQREQLGSLQHVILNKLSQEQRHVIILRFVECFNLEETARIIGRNVNNVKVIQNRALKRLREHLNETPRENQ